MGQNQPTAARRSFLIRRLVTEVTLPEALVKVLIRHMPSAHGRRRTVAVVTDLGEDAGPGHLGQTGKTGDDGMIGVLAEFLGRGLFEIVSAGAGGVEHRQQGHRLAAHGFFDQVRLPQLRDLQVLQDVGGQIVDAAFTPARRSAAAMRSW